MNGRQIIKTDSLNDISRTELALPERSQRLAASFMHPDEVIGDPWLTRAEKRELLASWASDFRAVPDAPALRQLDNGAVMRVDDVLRALKTLHDSAGPEITTPNPFWPFAGLRRRVPTRLKSALWRSRPDDDDDPPPCPAMIAGPLRGPLSGGETADLGLALAA